MSNDPQLPDKSPDRNPADFSKEFIGFGENDLWDLESEIPVELEEVAIPNPFTDPITAVETEAELPPEPPLAAGYPEAFEEAEHPIYASIPSQSEPPEAQSSPTPTASEHALGGFASLSRLEKISILAIAAILLISSVLSVLHFTKEIEIQPIGAHKLKFPIKGEIFTVSSIQTYWREPITQGENADIVRRGVRLVPVLNLQIEGSTGAIRILFRDSQDTLVGDSVSRAISGKQTLNIAATDGFADIGMHAAYRTGENPSWIIHVLEGPSVDAPITQFKTLFESEISADIR
jgi:hypothetical protein